MIYQRAARNGVYERLRQDILGCLLARAAIGVIEQFDRLTYVGVRGVDKSLGLHGFVEEHAKIIDAMKRRDKRLAQALVRRHVESSRKRTQEAIANPVIVP